MRPLLFASLAVGLAFVAQEGARMAVFPTGTVEARGGCDVRPESVTCWDMDGKPSPELAEGMRSALANGNDVSFRLGKKNRYVVARRPQSFQPQYWKGKETSLSATSTYNTDPVYDFIRLAVDPSDSWVTLSVRATIASPKEFDVPLKEGASVQSEGRTFEIGATSKVVGAKDRPPIYSYGPPPVGEAWSVVIGVTGSEQEYGYWTFTPLDHDGNPIRYVDSAGRPISALKALALEPNLPNGNNYNYGAPTPPRKPKAMNAFFQGAGPSPAFRASTNIDPKMIAKLRIRLSHPVSRDLGPFPLDPAK